MTCLSSTCCACIPSAARQTAVHLLSVAAKAPAPLRGQSENPCQYSFVLEMPRDHCNPQRFVLRLGAGAYIEAGPAHSVVSEISFIVSFITLPGIATSPETCSAHQSAVPDASQCPESGRLGLQNGHLFPVNIPSALLAVLLSLYPELLKVVLGHLQLLWHECQFAISQVLWHRGDSASQLRVRQVRTSWLLQDYKLPPQFLAPTVYCMAELSSLS